jgi:hypothetical protein
MIRSLALAAGLATALAGACNAQDHPLCIHGHPAPRAPGITFGGLPPKHGYQRDHWWSLGLGGPDTVANVQYQRCDLTGLYGRCEAGPAAVKDADEHEAEENMCSGRWLPDYARQWLAARWPIDAAHGYDFVAMSHSR